MEAEGYDVENPPEEEGATGGQSNFNLPKPGDVLSCDFRPTQAAPNGTGDISEARVVTDTPQVKPRTIKVMSWNIHRGYDQQGIQREIAKVNPDILFLQEVDMGCDRTEARDVGAEIASTLGYNLVFACEFEEIYSPQRKMEDQGGGVCGSCILSKYDFEVVRAIVHRVQPVDWTLPGPLPAEPRRGLRITPFVVVKTPFGHMGCYCIHLEEYCGLTFISSFIG